MRRALCFFVGLAFAACLPSADEYARGGTDAGSSSSSSSSSGSVTNEAGAPIDSGGTNDEAGFDGGDGGPVNVIANPGFEQGTCGPVNFYRGSGGTSNDAHTGSYACQVCRADESTEFYSFNPYDVILKPVLGATYHASAWVKRGAESYKDQQVVLYVRSANDQPSFTEVETAASGTTTLTDQWQFLHAKLTLTKDAQEVDFFVGANTLATAGQRCLIVDDVAVWRE